jgi:hypothetical protein
VQRRILAVLVTPCDSCGQVTERPWLGHLAQMVVADKPLCVDCGLFRLPEPSVSTYRSVSRAVIGLEERGLLHSKTKRANHHYSDDGRFVYTGYVHSKEVWLSDAALSVDWLAYLQASQHLARLAHEWMVGIECEDGCSSVLVFTALGECLARLAETAA